MKRSYWMVALIMLFWFMISFITNIIGPLIPDIIDNFHLQELALAGFIPTSFFIAYAVISIPAGLLIEKYSQKFVLSLGWGLPLVGSLLFALIPCFPVLLLSSFTIGLGMAMLQTTINPLTRVAGGEENFAFFSVMGQLVFSGASFVSPQVYSNLVALLSSGQKCSGITGVLQILTPAELPWVSLYWLFVGIVAIMIIIVLVLRLPKLDLNNDEKVSGIHAYRELLKNKYTYLFFLGILCYEATEQGCANWISKFLQDYHSMDPQTVGASAVGQFWGAMAVGCIAGLGALKLWDSRNVLKVACVMAFITLAMALFGTGEIARWAFPLFGFSLSVMYSIVFSLALNSVPRYQGAFAGILCTAIAGAALGPLIVAWLGDIFGLRGGMMFIFLTTAYVFSISFWAKPLVSNKTLRSKNQAA